MKIKGGKNCQKLGGCYNILLILGDEIKNHLSFQAFDSPLI